jgi:isopentenyl-diphosphate delta-isomerase
MTGGTPKAKKINAMIAQAVEELNLGMGIGSQRIALDHPEVIESFNVVRKKAPNAFIFANIGGAQLISKYGVKEAKKAIEMVQANALTIHLNALQEAIQPEGDTNYSNLITMICTLSETLDIPIIVKETGAGIRAEDAIILEKNGVDGIDVAGVGGTSWAAVEFYRAKTKNHALNQRYGKTFWNWGIPTAVSLVEVINSVNIPIIASGGIRNGIDVTKSLALGATLTSATYPFLSPALISSKKVKEALNCLIGELRNSMFLVGATSIKDLKKIPLLMMGKTAEWLRLRGFKPEIYARRK